jgi:hypothetical protein
MVLISGGDGEVPAQFDGKVVAATSTMIAVGTLSDADGPTHITLGEWHDGVEGLEQIYSGILTGLRGQIFVQTCNEDLLLLDEVTQSTAHVQIFANDRSEPDRLIILYK